MCVCVREWLHPGKLTLQSFWGQWQVRSSLIISYHLRASNKRPEIKPGSSARNDLTTSVEEHVGQQTPTALHWIIPNKAKPSASVRPVVVFMLGGQERSPFGQSSALTCPFSSTNKHSSEGIQLLQLQGRSSFVFPHPVHSGKILAWRKLRWISSLLLWIGIKRESCSTSSTMDLEQAHYRIFSNFLFAGLSFGKPALHMPDFWLFSPSCGLCSLCRSGSQPRCTGLFVQG